jgi:hypothetical protein
MAVVRSPRVLGRMRVPPVPTGVRAVSGRCDRQGVRRAPADHRALHGRNLHLDTGDRRHTQVGEHDHQRQEAVHRTLSAPMARAPRPRAAIDRKPTAPLAKGLGLPRSVAHGRAASRGLDPSRSFARHPTRRDQRGSPLTRPEELLELTASWTRRSVVRPYPASGGCLSRTEGTTRMGSQHAGNETRGLPSACAYRISSSRGSVTQPTRGRPMCFPDEA